MSANFITSSSESLEDTDWKTSPVVNASSKNFVHPRPIVSGAVDSGVSLLTVSHCNKRDYGSINSREEVSPVVSERPPPTGLVEGRASDPKKVVLDERQLIQLSEALQKIHSIIGSATSPVIPLRRRRKLHLPNWLVTDFLLFTLVTQVIVIGILTIVDGVFQGKKQRLPIDLILNIVMIVIEGLLFVLMAAATVKLARQIILRRTSFWFLVQCFLSSVLLYAGIYTVIYRFDSKSFIHFEPYLELDTQDKDAHLYTLLAFLQGLYLSASTATLCGGSQIAAQKLYSTSVVSSQMLLSFMYFASILSEAISASNPRNVTEEGITIKFFKLLKRMIDKVSEWLCCACCCNSGDRE